jgi:lipopolysaccharide export system protein LptC
MSEYAQTTSQAPPDAATTDAAPAAGGGGRRTRAGRAPRLSGSSRYSTFVGVMKLLLPAVAVALVLLAIAWPQITTDVERVGVDVAEFAGESGVGSTMINARFEGFDEHGRPFTVTADVASQLPGDETHMTLEIPKGDMFMDDGTWIAVSARHGAFDRLAELLELDGDVSVFHDKGFELRTESASVDLSNGTAFGQDPVEGHGPFGTIDAQGFRVKDQGNIVIFTGKTHLTLYNDPTEREE